jgi:hypothetical protein
MAETWIRREILVKIGCLTFGWLMKLSGAGRYMTATENLIIKCKRCGKDNLFDQPYLYHAGFADQGFLYNDAGTLTLVWNVTDPLFGELFPGQTSWALNLLNRLRFEGMLMPAPTGGRWRFRNPARCMHCAKPILKPMLKSVQYLVYPGSIVIGQDQQQGLKKYLIPAA